MPATTCVHDMVGAMPGVPDRPCQDKLAYTGDVVELPYGFMSLGVTTGIYKRMAAIAAAGGEIELMVIGSHGVFSADSSFLLARIETTVRKKRVKMTVNHVPHGLTSVEGTVRWVISMAESTGCRVKAVFFDSCCAGAPCVGQPSKLLRTDPRIGVWTAPDSAGRSMAFGGHADAPYAMVSCDGVPVFWAWAHGQVGPPHAPQ